MHVSAIIYFVSAIGCGNCVASLSQSQKNMYLTRHVITRYWGVDWLQCIEFCSEDRRCVSYNYGANSGLCELNDLAVPVCGSNSISDIRVAKGMVYHQIKVGEKNFALQWFRCLTEARCMSGGNSNLMQHNYNVRKIVLKI